MTAHGDEQTTGQMTGGHQPLEGGVAVIGASGALGGRIARELRNSLHPVLLVRDPSRIAEDLRDLPRYGVDLREPGKLTEALQATATPDGFAGIVNAAGVVAFGAFGSVPSTVTDELLRINTGAVIEMLDAVAGLVRPGGFVVNLTGVAGGMAIAGMGAYCASKTGAAAALKVAARELRPRAVRVLDVRLGHCETGLTERALYGTAPRLPRGIDPDTAARRIVRAILDGETDLPTEAFTSP